MRGKLICVMPCSTVDRITPADAGKTRTRKKKLRSARDHPRGCGENLGQLRFDTSILGSPPRMRGKPRWSSGVDAARRITPADAGKTFSPGTAGSREWDHPRGCGENGISVPSVKTITGSPPRMRGKPRSNLPNVYTDGITPADAGKT